jgi:glucose/arabinose dehydrogenase
MRRTTAILAMCVCAAAGCRRGAAQEPYDGAIAAATGPARPAVIDAAQTPEAWPIASEVDVPWTIALLSNAKTAAVKKTGKVMRVDKERDVAETIVKDADLYLAVDPGSAEEKPATPKTCSGVVNRRS